MTTAGTLVDANVLQAAFGAMLIEGALRGAPPVPAVLAGAVIFLTAKALKWWAIVSLGPFWTFRVIVVPGVRLVATGPYRWLRHPNYVGVMGELAGVALMTAAPWSGMTGDVRLARDPPCVRGRTGAPRRRSLSL